MAGRYLETTAIVRITHDLLHYPSEVFTFETGRTELEGEEIRRELIRIASLDDEAEFPESYQVSGRESETNWGASGSLAEYTIDISANIVATLGAAGISLLVHRAFTRIRGASGHRHDPLTPEQARDLLAEHLLRHYGVAREQLTEQESELALADGLFTYRFLAPDGTEYGGSVSGDDPLRVTRVWRRSEVPALRPEYREAFSEGESEAAEELEEREAAGSAGAEQAPAVSGGQEGNSPGGGPAGSLPDRAAPENAS
ncbi:hypothetical protein [Streptomyces physcomitrii]|uniref:Uncharacterized protein n=1 Tax=Streptomyces physcomitrii TaxID=2724184 RepID=A0ABX1GUJ4_9ACTN|nr:hypothetical protein [Streptomyces physcomitrii]NKI39733.1 hypothetical protein [Streptomyces physcomitrii]